MNPLRIAEERAISLPPSALWVAVADTGRLNRFIGLPPVSYGPASPDGLTRQASARWLGLFRVAWREHPFEWVAGEEYSVARDFDRGPLRRYVGRVSLRPVDVGTHLDVSCEVLPAFLLVVPLVRWTARRIVRSVLRYCEEYARNVQAGRTLPIPGAAAPKAEHEGLLEFLVDRARSAGADPTALGRIAVLLRDGGDADVVGMRPYALARAWGLDRRRTLDAFLAGAKVGLLRSTWRLLCPHCRVAKAEHHAVSQIQPRFHCDVCDREYEADPARNIELVFSPDPSVRRPRAEVWCLGGPANFPHVLVQRRLAAGAEADIPLPRVSEPLRLRALGSNHVAGIERAEDATESPRLTLSLDGWSSAAVQATAGDCRIRVANTLSIEAVVVVERSMWEADGLTAAEAKEVPSLRRLLETETRRPGTEGTFDLPAPEVLFAETVVSEAPSAKAPEHTLGRYRILGEIARGGMGIVYRAFDPDLSREVALKVTLFEEAWASSEFIARFLREARSAARLHHPNIVPVYDVGEAEGKHYFTMELIEGESLADRLRREGRLAPSSAAEMVAILSRAVEHAHGRGLVHRDLKPSNVLIARDGRYLLCDFGLSKEIGGRADLTQSGQIIGTPAYMSPEQAAGRHGDVDERTDVYALGAILYECLTGLPPFGLGSVGELLRKIQEDDLLPPRVVRPDVPPDLETIALKAMEKSKTLRFASARDLAEELDRFLRGEPILARPVGRIGRLWRRARRNRAVAVPIAALSLALVATLAVLVGSGVSELHRFRAHLVAAEDHLAGGRLDQALQEAIEAAALDPRNARPKATIARVFAARGRELVAAYTGHRQKERELLEAEPAGERDARWEQEAALLREKTLRGSNWSRSILMLHQALSYDPNLPETRALLARLYWDEYLDAERARDLAEMERYRPLVLEYGGQEMAERLRGEEEVRIRFLLPQGFSPPTLTTHLHVYQRVRATPVLAPAPYDPVGKRAVEEPMVGAWEPVPLAASTDAREAARRGSAFSWRRTEANRLLLPVDAGPRPFASFSMRLPRGSYVIDIPASNGLVETRYPFEVERGRPVTDTCELLPAGDVPPPPPEVREGTWVYLPAGRSRLGGDPDALRVDGRPEASVRVPEEGNTGLFIGRFEVTTGMYLAYLNDPQWHERKKAFARIPRGSSDPTSGTIYVEMDDHGRFVCIPGVLERDWPVIGLSRPDAEDYCRWLTHRIGDGAWAFRLPTENEWERAARGADGRYFPWGDIFDASFCCSLDSRSSERAKVDLEPYGLFPMDESPWGVRDLAGGVVEWTSDDLPVDRVAALVKGGCFCSVPTGSRSAHRGFRDHRDVYPFIGFRLIAERSQ